jgi:hypothetical protein
MNPNYPLPLKLYPIKDNFISLHQFLKSVYKESKESYAGGVSFFKQLFETNDKNSCNTNIFTLPINNFLKDLSQIEQEFHTEHVKNGGYCLCLQGRVLREEEILSQPMEENY